MVFCSKGESIECVCSDQGRKRPKSDAQVLKEKKKKKLEEVRTLNFFREGFDPCTC